MEVTNTIVSASTAPPDPSESSARFLAVMFTDPVVLLKEPAGEIDCSRIV